jgi:hypothetical protein
MNEKAGRDADQPHHGADAERDSRVGGHGTEPRSEATAYPSPGDMVSARAGSSITGDRPARRACGFRHGDRRLAISNHIDVSLAGGPPARGNHRNQQVYERRKPAAMASRSEQNQR